MTGLPTAQDIEPLFLEGGNGRLFALYIPPRSEIEIRGALLYVPPFAEEMNRCRSLAMAQARRLAELGYACLLFDFFGTGESEGELTHASWSIWRDDIRFATGWLERRTGQQVMLWGLRLGALLAADAARIEPDRFKRLLAWQPVADGKLYLTQILRQRVAYLMDRGLPAETTEQMRQAIQQGTPVEVAGYALAQPLVAGIDQARLAEMDGLRLPIEWFENVSEPEKPVSIGSQKIIGQLEAKAVKVSAHTFCSPPIWQLHDRDVAPDLLEKMTALFLPQ